MQIAVVSAGPQLSLLYRRFRQADDGRVILSRGVFKCNRPASVFVFCNIVRSKVWTDLLPGFPEIIEFVRAGVGVAFVPAGALPQPLPDEIGARLLSAPALSITVSMIRLTGRHMSPAAEAFWGLVLKHLKSEQSRHVARPVETRGARARKSSQARVLRAPQRNRAAG